MPFRTEILSDAPIIVHTLEPGPGMVHQMPAAMQEVGAALDAQPRPVYLVLDLRGLKMGLEDMMVASDKAARGPDALMHHPNLIETLFVLSDSYVRLGVMGMRSEVYGQAKLRTFDSLDAALEYCHTRLAEQAHPEKRPGRSDL